MGGGGFRQRRLGNGRQGRGAVLYGRCSNPINHARNRTPPRNATVSNPMSHRAGDVYSVPPHVGRGGWTWYSGSAGWMYRIGIEWILGLRLKGDTLVLDPCIPSHWPRFDATLHHKGAVYEIAVENPNGLCKGIAELYLDGMPVASAATGLALPGDRATHRIRAIMGEAKTLQQPQPAKAVL